MLTFTSVKKNYGSHLILDIPALTLDPGLYWLKGSNGAGKSTLLKMIAGMIPFEGEIELSCVRLRDHPVAYRRLVNYVEAEPLFPPFLSGSDLIRFFQNTRKASDEQVNSLQETFGISSFVKNPVNTYSSGMVKKLSLVLAFIGEPHLILLDEPLVTIDKESIPILYSVINDYSKKGINFIVASHQLLDSELIPPVKELSMLDHKLQSVL
jgi:ABC-2 type transport system ATP-binding protein